MSNARNLILHFQFTTTPNSVCCEQHKHVFPIVFTDIYAFRHLCIFQSVSLNKLFSILFRSQQRPLNQQYICLRCYRYLGWININVEYNACSHCVMCSLLCRVCLIYSNTTRGCIQAKYSFRLLRLQCATSLETPFAPPFYTSNNAPIEKLCISNQSFLGHLV